MTITQLIVFMKVAETGSFTKAAQALNMTQPAVSHAISSLESHLGVPLLIRDRRRKGLILSEVGKRILVHARGIGSLLGKIEQDVSAELGLEKGTIRIGSFPSASAHFVPKIIGALRRKYPQIEVDLLEGNYQEVEEWIVSREVDIGFVILPNEQLEAIPLVKDKLLLVLPQEHPLQQLPHVPLQKLDNEPFILSRGYEAPILQLFKEARIKLRTEFQVLNTGTLLSMIEEGLGLSLVGELAMPSLLPSVQIRELEPPVWREIGLACPSFKEASPAVHILVQLTLELFQP